MTDPLSAQDMLEDFIRHEIETCGGTPEDADMHIASFRKAFGGQFKHTPNPLMIAMMEAEKQETREFVKRLHSRPTGRAWGALSLDLARPWA